MFAGENGMSCVSFLDNLKAIGIVSIEDRCLVWYDNDGKRCDAQFVVACKYLFNAFRATPPHDTTLATCSFFVARNAYSIFGSTEEKPPIDHTNRAIIDFEALLHR